MFNSSAPSIADIAAVTGNSCGQNGYGFGGYGDGWWVLIILFALFGGWGRGGAFGNNGGCGCDGACATVGDVERGFNNQSTQQRFNGIDQGLCQLGYDNLAQTSNLQNTVMQGNFGLQQAINNASVASMQDTNSLSRQLADCCCETREAIQGVNFNMSQGFANQSFQLQQCCCDLKQAMSDNTRAITDQLTAFRMEDKNEQIAELRSQVQALNLAQSQANQNNYLIGQLRPSPVPAYTVANPYAGYGYGCCGTAQTCCC
jgi:hypothetical protein